MVKYINFVGINLYPDRTIQLVLAGKNLEGIEMIQKC